MEQSRKMSLLETVSNVLTGYLIAIMIQLIVFPWFDIETTITDNMQIAAVFTIISIARGYLFRRIFEKIRKRLIRKQSQ